MERPEVTQARTHVTSLAEVWIEILRTLYVPLCSLVTSLAEVWIEIALEDWRGVRWHVTSLAEVWIEINTERECRWTRSRSLPLRKCGLKS